MNFNAQTAHCEGGLCDARPTALLRALSAFCRVGLPIDVALLGTDEKCCTIIRVIFKYAFIHYSAHTHTSADPCLLEHYINFASSIL